MGGLDVVFRPDTRVDVLCSFSKDVQKIVCVHILSCTYLLYSVAIKSPLISIIIYRPLASSMASPCEPIRTNAGQNECDGCK